MKCDTCQHKNVCKRVTSMEKFDAEIKYLKKSMEYSTFGVEVRCDDYLKEQHILTR